MPTFKPVVKKSDLRKDKTYNVKIRLTHNRKSLYLKTPFYVDASMVTKKGAIKDKLILDKVQERCSEYSRKCIEAGFLVENMSINEVLEIITEGNKKEVNFFEYADEMILGLKDGGAKTYLTYSGFLKRLEVYCGNRLLNFSDIDNNFLEEYLKYLLDKGYKHGTINVTMNFMKTVFNDAIRRLNNEEIGRVVIRYNPFNRFNYSKRLLLTNDVQAIDDVETMQRIIDCDTRSEKSRVCKDIFIFSFTMLGINYADICELKKSDYKDGILTYCRKKTRTRRADRSLIKIKVNDVAKAIIERYRGDGELLFREDITSGKVKGLTPYALNAIAKTLGIPHFTFYTARHSMATFARNVCGVDKYIVHEMLNHASDANMRITDIYINKSYSHLWEANDKLLKLFSWERYLGTF